MIDKFTQPHSSHSLIISGLFQGKKIFVIIHFIVIEGQK